MLTLIQLVGCAVVLPTSHTSAALWEYSLVPGQSTTKDKPILQPHKGEIQYLRYSALETLTSSSLVTRKDVQVGLGDLDRATLDGISTFSDDKNLYIAWRSKLRADSDKGLGGRNDKMVYISRSADGVTYTTPKRISNGNGAFHPIVIGNKRGDIYVVWQDERTSASYDLYFNVSHDYGVTWKDQDQRLDIGKEGEFFSAEPVINVEGDSVSLTWVESGKGLCGVYVRTSTDHGENWRDAVEVAKCTTGQLFFPQLVRTNKNLQVYWYDTKSIFVATSSDNGLTWGSPVSIYESTGEGVKLQELNAKVDGLGTVHLFFGKKGAEKESRTNLYYIRSADGVIYSDAVRLNSGVEYQASAILPIVAFDSSGKVLVAWQDYRFFRSSVVGVQSPDNGKTWGEDFLLDSGPESGASQYPYLLHDGADWWLSYIHYDRNSAAKLENGRAVVKRVDVLTKPPLPVQKYDTADTSKLEKRVNRWWATRVKADWGASYDMMDPFMRSRTSRATYIASQGFVTYYGFSFVSFEMSTERHAKVKVKYTSEVPEMEINGKKYSVPKQETEITQDWIWVDGNWYFLLKDLMGNNFREL
jgi:hypothetical protein